jgi:la-related protein 1
MNMNAPTAPGGDSTSSPQEPGKGGADADLENPESWDDPGGRDGSVSPASRLIFKDFLKNFKAKEKESLAVGREYALRCLEWMPEKLHWRVLLELADLSKRDNRLDESRVLFQKVNELQPKGHQGWLEYAKMEEECGNLHECQRILARGVECCPENESLLLKSVKLAEKMGDMRMSRGLLARMRGLGVDKVWRVLLEGAQMEAREGNSETARMVFTFLLHQVRL